MFSEVFSTTIANIKGGKEHPNIKGTVYFKKNQKGVLVTAKIFGLPNYCLRIEFKNFLLCLRI